MALPKLQPPSQENITLTNYNKLVTASIPIRVIECIDNMIKSTIKSQNIKEDNIYFYVCFHVDDVFSKLYEEMDNVTLRLSEEEDGEEILKTMFSSANRNDELKKWTKIQIKEYYKLALILYYRLYRGFKMLIHSNNIFVILEEKQK